MNVVAKLNGTPCKALLLIVLLAAAVMASPQFDPSWSRLPSGTEIPELRTSTSHTYSNGDGTFTADITPGRTGGAESGDTAEPVSTGHIQRQIYHGIWLYFRGAPELHYVYDASEATVAYAKFDLASVPESSKIVNAEFRFYQYEYWGTVSTSVTYAAVNPDSTLNEQLYFAVRNGQTFAEQGHSYADWVVQTLNAAGNRIIGECLAQGWITLGINPTSGVGTSFGIYGDDRHTCLRIVYLRPDEPDIQTLRAELATYPTVAFGSDTALLTLTNRGLHASGPFWAYSSLGLKRESTLVEQIAVGQTTSVRIPLPSPPTFEVMMDYFLWANEEADGIRYNDSTRLQCWSFPPSTYAAEGFEGVAFPPPGWIASSGNGGTRGWTRQTETGRSHSGEGSAQCVSESTGSSDDWLISGPICPDRDYPDEAGFFTRSNYPPSADTLEVWVLSGKLGSVRLLSLDVPDTAYSHHSRRSVSLDTFDGDTVKIAFRYRSSSDWSGLCIDDIWFSRIFSPDTSDTGHVVLPHRDDVQRSVPQLPELAFASNPALGRYVLVKCYTADGTVSRLTLRDVLGRAVATFCVRSGTTRLDLHGFTAGVYMVTLDGVLPLVSRRLVITR